MELAQNSEPVSAEASDTFDLSNLLRVLRVRWQWIALGWGVGIALAVAYFNTATVMYESTTQVMIMSKDANLPTQGVGGRGELTNSTSQDLLATHMQLIVSPRIVKQALEERKLTNLASIVEYLDEDQGPVEYVIEQLEVERGGEGGAKDAHVLNVTLRLASAEDTEKVLAAIVESYQAFLGETFQDVSLEALKLIASAKDELLVELKDQEAAYTKFRETSPLMWQGATSLNVHQLRAAEIERALAEAKIRLTSVKSRLAIVEATRANGNMDGVEGLDQLALIDEKDIARLSLLVSVENGEASSGAFQAAQPTRMETARSEYDGLLALQMREATLLQDLGAEHPKVQETRHNIQQVSAFLENQKEIVGASKERSPVEAADLMRAYVLLLKHDVAALSARVEELEVQYKVEEDAAKTLTSFEIQGEAMAKEMRRKQDLYDAVVERLREINLVKDYGGFITEVISPVKLGEQAWPNLPIVLALGGMLGLMLGSCGALAAEMSDTTFRNVEEVKAALGAPLMACLPDLRAAGDAVFEGLPSDAPQVDASVLAFHRPKSREAEAIRGLRTSLYLSNAKGEVKVVQMTSANSGDGKTTMASNLAVSLAQSGKKVLLIDADLRRPRVAQVFAVDPTVGLSNVIVGEVELVDAVKDTAVNNLWLLPSGPIPPNPAELLSLPQFGQLLEVVRNQYDYVIVDGPPLLAVSDPLVIAPKVDAVLLVVRFSKNGRPAAERARDMLKLPGIKLMGVIVNGVGLHGGTRQGYGEYYYGAQGGDDAYYTQDAAAEEETVR